jgi:phage anti-repressor protein
LIRRTLTMNDLIPLSRGALSDPTIDTVGPPAAPIPRKPAIFSHWICDRIEHYEFVEGLDFATGSSFGENSPKPSSKGGRPTKDYHLTLHMAQELSMVERTEQGRQARRYFIECERRLKQGGGGAADVAVLVDRNERLSARRQRISNAPPRRKLTSWTSGSRWISPPSSRGPLTSRSSALASPTASCAETPRPGP